MTFRPRPYISFSQMTTLEMDERKFVEQYINNKKRRISRNMAYGSQFASALEEDELTGDMAMDLIMMQMPQLGINDKVFQCKNGEEVTYEQRGVIELVKVPFLRHGDERIPLLAIPDTAKPDYKAFKEYKTSTRPWTQKMADDSGQITFYCTAIWLGLGFIPKDIELVNVPVKYSPEGNLEPTGDIIRFKTTRNMVDIIKMTARIKKAWDRIGELSEQEIF